MINTKLDLVPPIRGLESFCFSMLFIVVEDGWWCFSLEVASIFFFFWFGRRVVITIVSGDRIMILISCDEC